MAFELKKLQEERGETESKLNDLKELWQVENRSATHDELTSFDNIEIKLADLDLQIATAERIEKSVPAPVAKTEERSNFHSNFAIHNGSNAWSEKLVNQALKAQLLREQGQTLNSEQRSAIQKCGLEGNRLSIENRANMSVGTPGAGGYLTQQLLLDRIVDSIAAVGGLLALVKTEPTDKGSDLRIPLADNTGRKATIRLEGGPQVPANFAFTSIAVPTYIYTDSVKVSVQLLRDSQYDLLGYITNGLGTALGVAQGEHLVSGGGTTAPWGLLSRTTAGKTTTSKSILTYDELLDMEASINPAVIAKGNCKWVFSKTALRAIKGMVDDNNVPLFHPSISVGAPPTVLGYPYVVDTWYGAMGTATNKVATFGDHSYMIRRTVGDMETGIDPYTYRASEGNISYFVEQSMGAEFAVASGFTPITHLALGAGT